MGIRVKVCGITNLPDAIAAVDAGAHALGFIFYQPSPRCVSPAQVRAIVDHLPPFVSKIGVFVNATPAAIRRVCRDCSLDAVQLHGDEPPELAARLPLPVIKAFRVKDAESLNTLPAYKTAAWLLDTFASGQFGGTGRPFDWALAIKACTLGRPVILSGGLTPDNVSEALRAVRPFAVDVSSGVETAPGKKDHAKVLKFVQAALAAGS